jgi:YVTN family beta-propeller protein
MMVLTMRFALALAISLILMVTVLTTSNNINATSGFKTDTLAASKNQVIFNITDEPGRWFKNTLGPIAGTQSIVIINPGTRVDFNITSNTVHTITSLIFPTGALGMPFDQPDPAKGSKSVTLNDPGLYVFFCKVHPYMFGAVIVDDPTTEGLDLGEKITLINGVEIPTSSDLTTRILRTFFIATNPSNWQDHTSTSTWHITYPDIDVRMTGGKLVNLPTILSQRYGNDITLVPLSNPSIPGVGEVWIDTQFELTGGKTKPGTATSVNVSSWEVTKKVALPEINMNNPHNMWSDKDQRVIYQTQWFDNKLTVFDRETGRLINNIAVGEAPAHVMTRTDTDQPHVTINGEDSVAELSPGGKNIQRKIPMQPDKGPRTHPHAHWLRYDGKIMVTPNPFTADSTMYDFGNNSIVAKILTGGGLESFTTGMMPDSSKYYVGNLLDSTISVIDMNTKHVTKMINLTANYNRNTGNITGPIGEQPIQLPVSPNGKYMVVANTLTGTILIIDTSTDEIIKMLPCDPGCHGVQFGAKQGGGYYAYISSIFSNEMLVVDGDPNNDENPTDATIAGRIALVDSQNTTTIRDDNIIGNAGMGGQGVLPIPTVYNGWVQNIPQLWKDKLTADQQNPYP